MIEYFLCLSVSPFGVSKYLWQNIIRVYLAMIERFYERKTLPYVLPNPSIEALCSRLNLIENQFESRRGFAKVDECATGFDERNTHTAINTFEGYLDEKGETIECFFFLLLS